ncbi:hypothetical protein PMAYCL1PPCAC_14749, partial [Pristionchus mayeri]
HCRAMWKSQQGEEPANLDELPQDAFGTAPWNSASARVIDRLLMLPSLSFWSTMADREDIRSWLDDVAAWIPRPYEVDRLRALDADGDVLSSVRLLKGSFLALFLRLAVFDKQKDSSMSAAEWLKRSRPILPLSRFARWLSPFAPPHDAKKKRNRTLFAKALQLMSNVDGARASEDMITLEGKQIEELADLRKDVDRLSGAWASARGVKRAAIAELTLQFMKGAVDWLYGAISFYRVAEAAKLRCRPAKLAPEIAAMVEQFSGFLTTDNVQEIAMHLADYPLRRVFRLRTQLEQFGVELVHDLLGAAAADKRPTIIADLLVSERFLYALDDRYSLEEMMAKGTLTQKDNANKILDAVRAKQSKSILADMSRLGLTKNLGSMSSMPQRVAMAVDEVMAIFPHLSTHYIHACLRHVGYEASEAIDMIVSERVPGWLRRLEGRPEESGGGGKGVKKQKQQEKKKWFEQMEGSANATRPPLTFDHEDCDLFDVVQTSSSSKETTSVEKEEKKKEEERNLFKGIFSLAPVQKKAEEPAEDVAKISLARAQEASTRAVSSIRASLERMKVRAHGEDEAFGMENERLVEMKSSKSHATADKYKTSAADKASIRPFYERFKYETDERDEDVYNDEYDDGYEEKAFKTDPLSNDIASSDEEKEKVEERSKTEERRGGG